MKTADNKTGISLLFGFTFLSPITYSVLLYEMDVVQRVVFFAISILLFLVYLRKINIKPVIKLNKLLFLLMVIYPITFLTAFLNNSSSLLLLKFSDLSIPMSIVLQSTILFIILGEEKFFKVVSYSVVIFSSIFVVIGVLEVFKIEVLNLPTVISPGSTLGNRSFAAEYLLASLPFFLICKEYISKKGKIYLLVAAIINIVFLLFTRNRSGLIILLVVVIFYIIFILWKKEKPEKLKQIGLILGILAVSFLVSLIPAKETQRPNLQSAANTLFDLEFKSNALRLSFWNASIQMIQEQPLTGVGLYKWSGFYPEYNGDYFTNETVTYVHSIHAHNDILELFAENGVIAALIFFSIVVLTAFTLFRNIIHNEKYFYLLLSFIITFAYSFVAFPNHKFASFFLAAVVTGPALIRNDKVDQFFFGMKFSKLNWLLIILIIFGGVTSYIRLKSELAFGEAIYLKDRAQYPLMSERLELISKIFYPFDASKQPVDYYRGIANSYLIRFKEALEDNIRAQKLAPYNPIIMRNIAGAYQNLNDLKNAIHQYEMVKKNFPNYISPQMNLLGLYNQTGQVEKEKSLYLELIKKSPDNPQLVPYKKKFEKE